MLLPSPWPPPVTRTIFEGADMVGKVGATSVTPKEEGQATRITPLNHVPLLPSGPGGVSGSWLYRTCPSHKGRHCIGHDPWLFLGRLSFSTQLDRTDACTTAPLSTMDASGWTCDRATWAVRSCGPSFRGNGVYGYDLFHRCCAKHLGISKRNEARAFGITIHIHFKSSGT